MAEWFDNQELPPGVSAQDAAAWLSANPNDQGRLVEALTPGAQPTAYNYGAGMPAESRFTGAAPSAMAPFTERFQAPTIEQARETPGFQFSLGEGLKALGRVKQAQIGARTGGTAKAIADYATNSADSLYDKVYGRALGEYDRRFTIHGANEGNRFSSERTNRMDDYGIFSGDRSFNLAREGDIWNRNRTQSRDQIGDLQWYAGFGDPLRMAPYGQAYGNAGAESAYGAGNATAAGQIASGNAAANAITSGVNNAITLAEMLRRRPDGYLPNYFRGA